MLLFKKCLTYFPIISTSIFTLFPTVKNLKLVSEKVYGITVTLNPTEEYSLTVKLTPLTVTDPFSII